MFSNMKKWSHRDPGQTRQAIRESSGHMVGQKIVTEPQLFFETKFSPPGSVFVRSCLNKSHKYEPHVNETVQPGNVLLYKRIGLPEKLQE